MYYIAETGRLLRRMKEQLDIIKCANKTIADAERKLKLIHKQLYKD